MENMLWTCGIIQAQQHFKEENSHNSSNLDSSKYGADFFVYELFSWSKL
jgi:hypothetical protein